MKWRVFTAKLRGMYEKHFGLNRRPFLAKVSGGDIFVGPQTALTMAGVRKALQVQDAVVAVVGPAGCGKSTLMSKALEAIAATHRHVRVGRMQLRGTDVLEYLLEELGVDRLPSGPLRQFSLLRKKLAELEAAAIKVVIVIEDAPQLGADTMAELEALTAADAGESSGAALIVMGDARLVRLMSDPQLIRLVQRIQHRHQVLPLSEPELRGYLTHCFRQAGGDFDRAFAGDAASVIHRLSHGIPRVANNIVEAALSAAAAQGEKPVTADLIADVAHAKFGLRLEPSQAPTPASAQPPKVSGKPDAEQADTPEADPAPAPDLAEPAKPVTDPVVPIAAAPAASPKAQPVPEQEAVPELEPQPESQAEAAPAPVPEREAVPEPTPEPVIVFSDEPCADIDDEIPELIQDTLPDLEVLASEIAGIETAGDTNPVAEPEPATKQAATDDGESSGLAELLPDLDALEQALAAAHSEEENASGPGETDMPVLKPEPLVDVEDPEELPEITLDNSIRERVDNKLIDEPDSVSANADNADVAKKSGNDIPGVKASPARARQADAELERIAIQLAKAKTIEDVDDKLAETLFGEEISLAAAEIAARVQAQQSANDADLNLFDTNAARMAQAAGTPVGDGDATPEPADEAASEPPRPRDATSGDHSGAPQAGAEPASASEASEAPVSIEDQIITSMTQTLKALNVEPPVLDRTGRIGDDEEDEEGQRKTGFFSRFRRS